MTISALKTNLNNLSIKDRDFASSLIASFDRYGSLSAKQIYWVTKLAEKATAPVTEREVVDLARIGGLFSKALSAGLKNPKIKVAGVTLSPAKATSTNIGATYVKQGTEYLGKITADGRWYPVASENATQAFEKVKAFACDPVKAAAAHGHATGNCCFCSRELSDAGSIEVGYGPICAEKYGLPHNPKGHGLKVSVGESHGHEDVVYDYDAQEYVSRDEEGYGWEDRALAAL
jgi:hypothetical protein